MPRASLQSHLSFPGRTLTRRLQTSSRTSTQKTCPTPLTRGTPRQRPQELKPRAERSRGALRSTGARAPVARPPGVWGYYTGGGPQNSVQLANDLRICCLQLPRLRRRLPFLQLQATTETSFFPTSGSKDSTDFSTPRTKSPASTTTSFLSGTRSPLGSTRSFITFYNPCHEWMARACLYT